MAPPHPILGTTRLYGIVGDPIAQVRSPQLFNAHFAERGIDAVFLPIHVRPADVAAFFAGCEALANLDGLVITIPHKAAFAALMGELGPNARRVGAVNTIRRVAPGRWEGELFDGIGFVEGLRGRGFDPAGQAFLIYGAGGAGAAITGALLDTRPSRIAVTDPLPGRAAALSQKLHAAVPGFAVEVVGPEVDPAAFDVVVNATPLGMQADDPLSVDPARLRPGTLVAEAIMKPPVTRLLREAEKRGCRIQPGAPMLDCQFGPMLDYFGLPR